MRKFTVIIALLLVVALATPAIGQSFPDVPSNHWAYEAINELVATGVIEGYPDGTYKGQENLTRYEIAMIITRLMDDMAEERAELMDRVEDMEDEDSGLSTEQAQDVTAIVKSLIEKNMPEEQEPPTELTDEQADQVVNLIEALTFEYQAEIKNLNSDYEDLRDDLGLLDDNLASVRERVSDLENPPVSFSGTYSVDFTHKDIIEDGSWSMGGGFNHYYIEEAPLEEYDAAGDADYELDDDEYEAYVSDVSTAITERARDLYENASMSDIATYYNTTFSPTVDLEAADVTEEHLAELVVEEFNTALLDPAALPLTDDPYTTSSVEDYFSTELGNVNTGYASADYRIQEDTSLDSTYLPMWSSLGADAMAFTETAELAHTLNLNANIDYAGFEGQAGVELEMLDSTDEVTFKSADLELENDTLYMNYNEANEIDYSYFAVHEETFNAASFLYKPWGLNFFVGMDEVVTGYEDPLTNEDRGDEELNVFYADRDATADDVYDLYFDGGEVAVTNEYIVKGAQKSFGLGMADITVTGAGRIDPDWNTEKYFESLVFGAEAETTMSGFDVSSDVAVNTFGEFDDYGYMVKLDGSTDLMDAFTVGANYKRQDAFEDLYGSDSVFDYEEAGDDYDKYGEGLDALDSGYGLFVDHDGDADGALVSGLDLGFSYDAANYDDETDTRIGGTASMDVMDNLTVNGSYTQLNEPSGMETDYVEETVLYDVGATFEPMEDAEITGIYSVVDPVEDTYTTATGNTYDTVNETTMGINGSYDFNDYISVSAGYTTIDGLGYYEGAEKTTTTLGASLSEYPIMTGLTGSAALDYSSVSGKQFNDLDTTYNAWDFNPDAIYPESDLGLLNIDVTTISFTGGLAYTLNDRTELTYDLEYTMQDAVEDEASYQYSGDYIENAVGVEYTFTEEADLTADYKHMMMKYDDTVSADDWTAHQFEAGVSISF